MSLRDYLHMLIILDRDGVINVDSEVYIKSPEEWIPIPGSLEKIAKLSQQGYKIAIATNQSGVARGLFDEMILASIHKKLQDALSQLGGHVDLIVYCPHHPDEGCACRKPKPGLLLNIAHYFQSDLRKAWFVGDSLVDIQAAKAVGCQAVLVKTGKGKKTLDALFDREDILVFEDLASVLFPEI